MFYLCCYHDWPSRKSEIRENPPPFWPNTEGYSSRSAGYETEAELREKAKVHDKPCVECGSIFNTNYFEPIGQRLREACMCHHCDHFLKLIGREHALRIEGVHWMGKAGDKGQGCGGRTFRIRMLDTGEEFETSNLWCQGNIPPHFRDRLPDNAEFVKPEIPEPV